MTYFTTAVYVQLLGFAIQCSLTHSVSLIICFSPFIHTFAPCFFQILNYSRHPCIWLMVPVGRPIEDFHLLGIEHAWHTKRELILLVYKSALRPMINNRKFLFSLFIPTGYRCGHFPAVNPDHLCSCWVNNAEIIKNQLCFCPGTNS